MIHVLAGSADDVDSVLKAATSGKSLAWRVPKKSHVNESALFHLPARGFAARGVIASEPRQYEPGRYTAKVGSIEPLASAVPLAFVQKNHSTWPWLNAYTKGYTTIDGDIEARLKEVAHGIPRRVRRIINRGRFEVRFNHDIRAQSAWLVSSTSHTTEQTATRAGSLSARSTGIPPMGTFTFTT
jgi:hypothetical protein